MPVLKVKTKDGWDDVFGISNHTHKIGDITDFPADLSPGGIGSAGLSDEAKNMLITILRSFATDEAQISNIDALEVALFADSTAASTAVLGTGVLGKLTLGKGR